MIHNLLTLAGLFGELSLLAVGGGATVLPEMQRQVVNVHHWMSGADFAALFALAQASPGPNFMVISLIGWKVAGIAGAAAATAAICLPCAALTFAVSRVWQHFHEARWRRAVQVGLVPITVGLVLATGYLLGRAADQGWVTAALTLGTLALTLWTRVHPLVVFAAAGLIGIFGLA